LSSSLHWTPLCLLCVWPEAKQLRNGLSAVNTDVIVIVLSKDGCWGYLSQVINVVKLIVDMIGNCESCQTTLADCMLQLLSIVWSLSVMTCEEGEDQEFLNHTCRVFDKHFKTIAMPIHKLALFLHPLCCCLAIWKWGWTEAEKLYEDVDCYYQCKEPFTRGTSNAREWWKSLPIQSRSHPLKSFAITIHSTVPLLCYHYPLYCPSYS
ncbi:hypothetical protein L218DRAFT_1021215, partial [Marasmius fiardii PR-910]